MLLHLILVSIWGSLMAQLVKNPLAIMGDLHSIPGLGRSPGEGKGYPLQYSGLENSMDCIVHGLAESDTTERLSLSLVSIYIPQHNFEMFVFLCTIPYNAGNFKQTSCLNYVSVGKHLSRNILLTKLKHSLWNEWGSQGRNGTVPHSTHHKSAQIN